MRLGGPAEVYGRILEGAYVAGHSFERVCSHLEWLLQEDRWRSVGGGFDDVNKFLESIRLDSLRVSADQRKRLAKLIKDLQPDASQRAIGRTLGVDESTVRADLDAGNPALANKKDSDNNTQTDGSAGNPALTPSISGEAAARMIGGRAERKAKKEAAKSKVLSAEFSSDGPFGTVVIDPPWEIEKIDRDVRPNQAEFDYPTMSLGEIKAFWKTEMAERIEQDCHLFMWTTNKILPSAIDLIGAIDFRYVLTMVWHKAGGFQPVDLPQYNCEFVIYARRGSPLFVDTKGFFCCFDGERREHSRKPDNFYDVIRRVTGGSRIDVFSREKREGYAQFGNEVDRFSEVA